jgi:hypothetical protein
LKIIAAIEDPPVIVKILSHLGLPTRAPPRSPARRALLNFFKLLSSTPGDAVEFVNPNKIRRSIRFLRMTC